MTYTQWILLSGYDAMPGQLEQNRKATLVTIQPRCGTIQKG